jgi:uncharacterized membrane protein
MDVLIERINEKNNWGKNELTKLICETLSKYTNKALRGTEAMDSYVKENIIIDTLNYILIKIQEKTSWGKNVLCDMIFKKLAEEISS